MVEIAAEAKTLLDGLREEVDLYRRVLTLSTEELGLVRDAELEKATATLSSKQQRLEDIATIESRIKPHKERWPEIRASLASSPLAAFQAVLKDLSDLLEKLIEIERETEETLSRQIGIVRRSAPAAAAEERARKAYGAQKEGKKRN